ncbi:MAG TPA: class I SAM-dependent methyltransferase [Candidatus Sulfotelmatobacter sp.]|nr:class I SAM-dependent methyltransferase [Candidatus Sulfotelmatobacter sp.]
MQDGDKLFSGSIAALYDRHLGPLLFQPYADDLARRLGDLAGGDLLEIAAGTGIVTAALCAALPPAVAVTATDLNPAMLEAAAQKPGLARARFRQADAQALPFADTSFDAVVCQFGVMFFPDKAGAYGEMRRVLRPGGRLLFNVWDKIEANPLSQAVTDTVAALFPADPPRFLARTPHGYCDIGAIRAALAAAGFRDIAAETVALTGGAPDARAAAIGLCQGTPLRNEIEARAADRLTEVTDEVAAMLRARYGAGAIADRIQAIVFSARA